MVVSHRGSPNGEWYASTMARVNSHNTGKNGEIFGDTYVTDPGDTYPLLAHVYLMILGQKDIMSLQV